MLDDPTRPAALPPVQPIRFLEDPDEPSRTRSIPAS